MRGEHMVRFGMIGTNSISHTFMEASKDVEEFELKAVYSRTEENGREFANRYGAEKVYTSLEAMAADEDIDAVYVASPNSCHAEQSIVMLKHGKHVICEKPVSSNQEELEAMLAAARENHVIVLEAMRSIFDPGFARIKELLPSLGTIRRVVFQYCQYSSRYDKFKEGVVMNAFNPALSNAAVMDIGVYCIHPMAALFGMPESLHAESIFLDNGMEGMGTVIASYPGMQAILQYSKITASFLPSQIQGEDGSMVIREIPDTREIDLYLRKEEPQHIVIDKKANNMYYEISEFVRLISLGEEGIRQSEAYNSVSMMEMQLMNKIREKAGIKFTSK